ncbi:ribose-phosphate diphosphokinase [Paenibacillus sp. FSL R5-0527]|uniref:ribose-phosphate diphosphokinase n=1 Tax=Paenibacillus sp. FSL R5-0527 TaxID=2975321 RepID=UPI00097A1DA4|nr:hypothetical protein BK140_01345 [Paenibacillus macerans]
MEFGITMLQKEQHALFRELSSRLNLPMCLAKRNIFRNNEISIEMDPQNIRPHMIVLYSMEADINRSLIELFILLDTLKSNGALTIYLFLSYFPYEKANRRNEDHSNISSKLMCDLMCEAGASAIYSVNLLSGSLESMSRNIYNLDAKPVFVERYRQERLKPFRGTASIIAADLLDIDAAVKLSHALKIPFSGFLSRKRDPLTEGRTWHLTCDDIKGRNVLLFANEIETGETIKTSIQYLYEKSAKDIELVCVHPKFLITNCSLLKELDHVSLVVTDTIPCLMPEEARINRFEIVSMAPVLYKSIMELVKHREILANS